jgi:hypothetical protein
MKNIIVKIVAGILLLIILYFLIFKTNSEEKPFNQIQLTENNFIYNEKFPTYYDTILMVAMDEAELAGFNVMLRELTDGAKSQFDGDLKAHIRYQNDDFYLFTGKMSKNEAIEVLSHEVIHMLQYRSGNLSYTNGKVTWMGEVLDLNSKEYEQRPWEVEAFQKQSQLMGMVKESLWGDN